MPTEEPNVAEIARSLPRFWANVDRRGDDECWLWKGWKNIKGYGGIKIGGEPFQAHRFMLTLLSDTPGIPPIGLFALHSCDNPSCVNPAHLRWGTPQDNARDAVLRGRCCRWAGKRRGDQNPNARLTRDMVADIRRSGRSVSSLAAEYGLSYSAMWAVCRGVSWKGVE